MMMLFVPIAHATLLSPESTGFGDQTRSENYDSLVNAMCANTNVVTTIGDKLWVPWYSSSTNCGTSDLQAGDNCASGETIDSTHNCMVSDEFSQVGILIAMSKDQTRMNQFYNTIKAIQSTHGQLPAWRIYRNGDSIEACKTGINGNCDTASDATARIIMALFTASENQYFADQAQKNAYHTLALALTDDFLKYEVVNTCMPSDQGYGDICWWLASGSEAKTSGMESSDFAYTGYYSDAIDAMLMACSSTGNAKYCEVAGNFTLNYLQAAKFDGTTFTAPPGRSFKWSTSTNGGVPTAVCTNTCSPIEWDGADAPRALGICQANYYAKQIGVTLPRLQSYCDLWGTQHYTSASSTPLQFSPDGTSVTDSQTGYFAQGLAALFQSGSNNTALFAPTLDNALSHYSASTQKWDNTACFGVYTEAFAVRALGFGIGRDAASFSTVAFVTVNPTSAITPVTTTTAPILTPVITTTTPAILPVTTTISTTTGSCVAKVNDLPVTCIGGTVTMDTKAGCRTIVCANSGDSLQIQACDKPDGESPRYFEMYKQGQIGTRVSRICLGATCISNNGFSRADYPVCAGSVTSTSGSTTSDTTGTPVIAAVRLSIAPWFPQGKNYVFKCNAAGFTPTSYDWDFGDGQRQFDTTRSNIYHKYDTAGSRTVTCIGKNGQTTKSDTLTVKV